MKKIKLPISSSPRESVIRLHNVAKRYGETTAVDIISLEVVEGETLALLGPSGCGKTSTLRLIAGLEVPDWGEIHLHNTLASTPKKVVAPHKRGISMVFQDLALWPHMTVAQHIDFALPAGQSKKQRQAATADILNLVRLPYPKKYPNQLSGGEKQRLAIGRTLASESKILLMDEPFSSLDSSLKDELLEELKSLISRLGITVVYVTHHWQEAIRLADRIALMADGKITQCAPVQEFIAGDQHLDDTFRTTQKKEQNIIHLQARF